MASGSVGRDRFPDLAALAKQNAECNGLAARVTAVPLDVAAPARPLLRPGSGPNDRARLMIRRSTIRAAIVPRPRLGPASPMRVRTGRSPLWRRSRRGCAPARDLTLIWRAEGLADTRRAGPAFGGVACCDSRKARRGGNPGSWCGHEGEQGAACDVAGLDPHDQAGRPTPESRSDIACRRRVATGERLELCLLRMRRCLAMQRPLGHSLVIRPSARAALRLRSR